EVLALELAGIPASLYVGCRSNLGADAGPPGATGPGPGQGTRGALPVTRGRGAAPGRPASPASSGPRLAGPPAMRARRGAVGARTRGRWRVGPWGRRVVPPPVEVCGGSRGSRAARTPPLGGQGALGPVPAPRPRGRSRAAGPAPWIRLVRAVAGQTAGHARKS